jgi:SAM-dependent methyltransferase
MSFLSVAKRYVPRPLRRPLRRCLDILRLTTGYRSRIAAEIASFEDVNVYDLPAIAHYWSNKHLLPILAPFGFTDAIQCFRLYMARLCRESPDITLTFLSIGAGTCESEIKIAEWLRENSLQNYVFECADINPGLLAKGRKSAEEKDLSKHFVFTPFDVNRWKISREYQVVVAFQSLHHFVELEVLFDKIHRALHPDGYFMADDMIGRNGHQRWPEALKFVHEFWRELPERYTYNHGLKRFEKMYENYDCSTSGFEGIRAQDILPLLVKRFHFDFFFAFANVVDPFVERTFGPNFDPEREWDRDFIDRVHALDVAEIEAGRVKPTHMMAVMTKKPVQQTKMHKHLSPEFCIRRP